MNQPITKMQRRNRKNRGSVERMMVESANSRDLLILHRDILIVSRQMDLCAAAAILPHENPHPGQEEDFIFLYLDLEEMADLEPGFYSIRIFRDENGKIKDQAHLLNLRGQFVHSCRFMQTDPHLPILGKRFQIESRHILIDSWIRRGEAYAIEGMLGNGKPFVVTLEF